MKKGFAVLLLLFLFAGSLVCTNRFFCIKAESLNSRDISAEAAILVCADSNEVLFCVNENKKLPIASTTKIMTSVLGLEALTPNLEVVVTEDMVKVEGSSIGLLPGDKISLKELVCGMMLESGNDAANVTAYAVGGTLSGFVQKMNDKAKAIGMGKTNFVTPSGLDAKDHYSTAYDLALLALYAIKNPEFKNICSQSSIKATYGNPPYLRTFFNHNKLLHSYDGVIGMKTGFTKKSGRCLVSVAVRNDITLIAVTLNAPNDWVDHKKMLDYGFSCVFRFDLDNNFDKTNINIVGGIKSSASIGSLIKPYTVISSKNVKVTREIFLKPFEYAPAKIGTVVGNAKYYIGNKLVCDVPLGIIEQVDSKLYENKNNKNTTIFEKMKELLTWHKENNNE